MSGEGKDSYDGKSGREGKENEVPEGFICPISKVIMKDPYIDSDGNSYEKNEILNWLRVKPISPITRNPIDASKLVPNRNLKSMIEDFTRINNSYVLPQIARTATILHEPALTRKPLILFAVIDNSGSMSESCGSNGTGEDDGYSRLDLVKHTLNTIITSLTEYDKICIIKFSTVAAVFSELTSLTEVNKKQLMERLKNLEPENQTNIWDGLRVAVDMITTIQNGPAFSSVKGQLTTSNGGENEFSEPNIEIYLLTDGEPTINPPGPIVDTLRNYLTRKCPGRFPTIHTFGYGYRLDSQMLFNIAKVGNGIFGFIPDSTMVGTVFINALSHSLLRSGATFSASQVATSLIEGLLSNAVSGQSGSAGSAEYNVEIMSRVTSKVVDLLESLLGTGSDIQRVAILSEFNTFCSDLVASIEGVVGRDDKVRAYLADVIVDTTDNADPNLGQIMKSANDLFFAKWGKHYLYSVLSAYQQRVCINFKDKGIQHFKSPAFIVEQQRIEDAFVQLAPPKPSRNQHQYDYRNQQYGGGGGGAYPQASSAAAAPVQMTSYYNVSGGCFSGDSYVFGADPNGGSEFVRVDSLRKGSKVMTNKGETAVECVIRMKYTGKLHAIGTSLQLTPYHPVLINSVSHFPVEIQGSVTSGYGTAYDGHVYDFILENRGIIACPFVSVQSGFTASISTSSSSSSSSYSTSTSAFTSSNAVSSNSNSSSSGSSNNVVAAPSAAMDIKSEELADLHQLLSDDVDENETEPAAESENAPSKVAKKESIGMTPIKNELFALNGNDIFAIGSASKQQQSSAISQANAANVIPVSGMVYCATFGHNFMMQKFAHDYFGSEKVVDDFKTLDAAGYFERGFIDVKEVKYARNVKDNLVTHLNQEKVGVK